MEIAFIVVSIIVGLIFWLRADATKAARRYPRSGSKFPKIKRLPFDAKSAEPLNAPLVLIGAAYVIDGDTLVIQKTQIRLFGVDAPEMNHPYGRKAKGELISLCNGQKVRAEVSQKDAYGRTVARCYLENGSDLSAEMVKKGLALDWPKFSGGKYRAFEVPDARKKLWLADARQKGRMHIWEQFDAKQNARIAEKQMSQGSGGNSRKF